MEKQYSEEFFSMFVDNLQKLCRNFLDFEQVCEVSGYVCLMMDNSKQERYVLSEMVHDSGSVISESYCTKAFRTLPLQRRVPLQNISQRNIPQRNIPQQNIPQQNIPQQNIPQRNISQQNVPQRNIPQRNIPPQHGIPQRNVPQPSELYEENFDEEFDDEDYASSMDSCTHSSMDSATGFTGEGDHGLAIADIQSLSSSHKSQVPTSDSNSRNSSQILKLQCPEEPRIIAGKDIMIKKEICEEPDSKDMDRKKTFDPKLQNVMAKRVQYEEEEEEEEEDIYDHSVKLESATSTTHEEAFLPLQAQHKLVDEGLVQVKQEPETSEFIPNVEINSDISDLNILQDEFLIAEPIGYLKSKDVSRSKTGPNTKTTKRKVYVPLPTPSSRPGENIAIQPRKFIKLVRSDSTDDIRVAQHAPEHLHDEQHPDSDSDFMYDSQVSSEASCSDMGSQHSYNSDEMEEDNSNLSIEAHREFVSGRMEQGTNLPPHSHHTFAPGQGEKDTSNKSVERHHAFAPSRLEQGTKLPPDSRPTFASGHSEKETSSLPVERHHGYAASRLEQGTKLPGHMEQGAKLPPEKHNVIASSHSDKENSNLSSERQHAYVSSHMEKGTNLPPDRRHAIVSRHGEQDHSNLSLERQDTYTSSRMEQGIALHAAIASGHGEQDNSKLSIERQDTYTSSRMEQGIAMRAAIASGHSEQDTSNLSLERQDTYTSSRMEHGIALRATIESDHGEQDNSNLSLERQDTYTSSRMEQGIALRKTIELGHSETKSSNLSLDSHHIYEQVTSTESHHPFVSSPIEQKPSNLPTDSHKASGPGHVEKVPSNVPNISLMEESGDEIIELDSDDIEGDEGLAAANASLSLHTFSQSATNEPSTSSQSALVNEPAKKQMLFAVNLFTEYQRQQGYSEPLHLIPPQKLDTLLANFYENVKTKTGEDFTPFSLKNVQNHLQKYLREHNYPYSITSDVAFNKSREKLRNKIEELRGKVKTIPQKPDAVTEEDVEILFQNNQLGACSPDILFNTMWFMNTMFLGIKSRIEHYNLKWGDIVINMDHTGREFLRYIGSKQAVKNRSKPLFALMDDPDVCFVELYKIFEDRRHPDLLKSDAPFYGTVNKFPADQPWFLPEQASSARFNGLMQKMAKEAGLSPGRKFTNSSCFVKSLSSS